MNSQPSNLLCINYKNSLSKWAGYGNVIAIACAFYAIAIFIYGFHFLTDNAVINAIWLQQILLACGLPANSKYVIAFFATLALLPLIVIFSFACYAKRNLSDPCIRLTADSILFPPCFMPALNWRRQRLWQDVSHVLVAGNSPRLILYFKSGGRASLHTDRLNDDEVEQLALIIEMRAEQAARRNPDLALFLDSLHRKKINNGELSFTQIWEEQMNRNFSATVFIPLEPGNLLEAGQLKILRQVSFGGFSAVYLAQDKSGNRFIVKESVPPKICDEMRRAKAEEMLKKEFDILMRLSHPQIVKAWKSFKEKEKTYLVLDYIPGENLRQIISQKEPASQKQVLDWAKQLAEIMVYLHSLNPPLIHRDISPDNIVLGANEKLILIDFGAANEFLEQATGTLIGKQAYIPPEQFKGRATTTSDIYAFGATLYFLITGQDPLPFSRSHPMQIKDNISPELDLLISDCTVLDPTERIQSAQQLVARLNDIGGERLLLKAQEGLNS
jgi:tRNA A-37 threonylcarbamoyl transferase component Bud32